MENAHNDPTYTATPCIRKTGSSCCNPSFIYTLIKMIGYAKNELLGYKKATAVYTVALYWLGNKDSNLG